MILSQKRQPFTRTIFPLCDNLNVPNAYLLFYTRQEETDGGGWDDSSTQHTHAEADEKERQGKKMPSSSLSARGGSVFREINEAMAKDGGGWDEPYEADNKGRQGKKKKRKGHSTSSMGGPTGSNQQPTVRYGPPVLPLPYSGAVGSLRPGGGPDDALAGAAANATQSGRKPKRSNRYRDFSDEATAANNNIAVRPMRGPDDCMSDEGLPGADDDVGMSAIAPTLRQSSGGVASGHSNDGYLGLGDIGPDNVAYGYGSVYDDVRRGWGDEGRGTADDDDDDDIDDIDDNVANANVATMGKGTQRQGHGGRRQQGGQWGAKAQQQQQQQQPAAAAGGGARQKKKIVCNCKKSRCLKLYCECFTALQECDGCNCLDCRNTSQFKAMRDEAIRTTRAKNPQAFRIKITGKDKGHGVESHSTGCRCKKSACLKKYCECYEAGIFCGAKCRCLGCANYVGSQRLVERRKKVKDYRGARRAEEAGRRQHQPQTGLAQQHHHQQPPPPQPAVVVAPPPPLNAKGKEATPSANNANIAKQQVQPIKVPGAGAGNPAAKQQGGGPAKSVTPSPTASAAQQQQQQQQAVADAVVPPPPLAPSSSEEEEVKSAHTLVVDDDKLSLRVMSYVGSTSLDPRSLLSLGAVNRRWRERVEDERMWRLEGPA